MDQKQFLTFKAKVDCMSISALLDQSSRLFNKITCRNECIDNDKLLYNINMQKSDMYWMLMERKIRSTIYRKGDGRSAYSRNHERTPYLHEVLAIQTPKSPPLSVIRTFVDMCHSLSDITKLAIAYPECLKIKLRNGDLLLHRVIEMGGYGAKNTIEFIIFSCMNVNIDFSNEDEAEEPIKYGGLTVQNNMGRCPLAIIYGFVAYHVSRNPYHERWVWLCELIQKVVSTQSHNRGLRFDLKECHPLLHASLEIGCPLGLMNRILDACTVEQLCKIDHFGRSPLMIALSNKHTPAEIILKLFRRTPVEFLQILNMDCEGDCPLHCVLKSGIKYHCRSDDELVLIGTIVENYPQAMGMLDKVLGIPPYMIAAMDDAWSLDVVYGLLRTEPCAL